MNTYRVLGIAVVLVYIKEKYTSLRQGMNIAASIGGKGDGAVVETIELRPDGLLEINKDQDRGSLAQAAERRRCNSRRRRRLHWID